MLSDVANLVVTRDTAFLVYQDLDGEECREVRVDLSVDITDFVAKVGVMNGHSLEEWGLHVRNVVGREKGVWQADTPASCQNGTWICPVKWYVR